MADGVILERRGLQTATIVTDAFKASSDAMARRQGFPGYRYVMIAHPLSSLTPEECKRRASEVLTDVLSTLGVEEKALASGLGSAPPR